MARLTSVTLLFAALLSVASTTVVAAASAVEGPGYGHAHVTQATMDAVYREHSPSASPNGGIVIDDATCATAPAATLTWNAAACHGTQPLITAAACWTPARTPAAADVLYFPAATKVTFVAQNISFLYDVLTVSSVVLESGADVTLLGNAWQVTDCLIIDASAMLQLQGLSWTQGPTDPSVFQKDPSIPEGTDCSVVPIGFTPRLCGPGRLRLRGMLIVDGRGFASSMISGIVEASGHLALNGGAFLWGNITIHGQVSSYDAAYIHGFFYVQSGGQLQLTTIWYDKWATSYTASPPLLIYNAVGGTVNFFSQQLTTIAAYQNSQGVYHALLVNHGYVQFSLSVNSSLWNQFIAGVEFDIFNFGTVAWLNQGLPFYGSGTTLNFGTLIANGTYVYLSSMHSQGGHLQTLNGGQFQFGNGASNPQALKLCQMFGDHSHYFRLIQEREAQKRQLTAMANAERREQLPKLNLVAKDADRDCWWYLGICYSAPYIGSAPELHLDQRLSMNTLVKRQLAKLQQQPQLEGKKMSVGHPERKSTARAEASGARHHVQGAPRRSSSTSVVVEVVKLVADSTAERQAALVEAPCNLRYAFSRTRISGDGSKGSGVVTTLPVAIQDKVTIEAGGAWFVIQERYQSPIKGTGDVIVTKGGMLVLSIEADFRHGGNIVVQRGATLLIPAHGRVRFSNASLAIARGGVLHVDGQLSLLRTPSSSSSAATEGAGGSVWHHPIAEGFHLFENCGTLIGKGRVAKEADDDLGCLQGGDGLKTSGKEHHRERHSGIRRLSVKKGNSDIPPRQ